MPILTQRDLDFFEENGYVVVHDAVPLKNRQAVIDAIGWFTNIDMTNPNDWYNAYGNGSGVLELYQHQALWDNRQHPRLHQVFSEIWKTEKLWVSMDRVGYKPPQHPDHPKWNHKGFLHIDADASRLPIPFGVQGVLYLTDTTEDMGGFHCLPGWHKRSEEWAKVQTGRGGLHGADWETYPVKTIPGKAGDLLIWHKALPHGSGKNTSNRLRLCQYISMSPAKDDGQARQDRIRLWRERLHPPLRPFPGDPRKLEQTHGTTAELTPLGQKLLGLDPW